MKINWYYMGDTLPEFLTIAGIPFMYNIAYGLITGIIAYIIIDTVPLLLMKVTDGRLVSPGWYTEREPLGNTVRSSVLIDENKVYPRWKLVVLTKGILPPWIKNPITGDMHFLRISE